MFPISFQVFTQFPVRCQTSLSSLSTTATIFQNLRTTVRALVPLS